MWAGAFSSLVKVNTAPILLLWSLALSLVAISFPGIVFIVTICSLKKESDCIKILNILGSRACLFNVYLSLMYVMGVWG